MKRRLVAPAMCGLLSLTFVSCATIDAPTGAPPSALASNGPAEPEVAVVDASVVRGAAQYDYDPAANLPDLVERTSVAVSGTVISWSEGRSIVDAGDAERYAVLAVEVGTAAKTADKAQQDIVYVSVYRGTEGIDGDGQPIRIEGAPASVTPIVDLQRAVPEGTRVIVIGSPTVSVTEQEYAPYVKVRDARAGIPDGASLVDAWPQGLIFETANGGFDGGIVNAEELSGWGESAARQAHSKATRPEDAGSFENLLAQLDSLAR